MTKLQFSPMTLEDIPSVMLTEEAVYPFPWTNGIFQDCIRVGYQCWLAYEDGRLIGHAVMSIAAGESHLLNLSIAEQDQGKGYGRQFVEFLMKIASERGAASMLLEVRPSNVAAIQLYQSCDFNEIGCRKDYYPSENGREHALLFARELIANQEVG